MALGRPRSMIATVGVLLTFIIVFLSLSSSTVSQDSRLNFFRGPFSEISFHQSKGYVADASRVSDPKYSVETETKQSKYAFVTYLAPTDNEQDENADEDFYLISVRMLAYQLLHDPETRTNTSIPFVVLVSPETNQSKRDRLQHEGALVVQHDSISNSWMKPGRDRWMHVMDKLNVFKLTQYEKVLLMDSDIVIFKRLDGVFDEPETKLQTNLGKRNQAPEDEGKQPQIYLMAADSSPVDRDKHKWPAKRNGILNAGFVIVHPSEDMFNHMLQVASIENRTRGGAPENNLWEYIHRKDGNMPFSHLKEGWIINSANYGDYEHGVCAVHEKWWRNSMTDLKLKAVLQRSRWRMDGYWSRDE